MATAAQSGDQWRPAPQHAANERGGILSSSAPPGQQAILLGPMALVLLGGLIGIFAFLVGTIGIVGVVAILAGISLVVVGLILRSS